jgi:hypothetical protein
MVRANQLTPTALIEALERGDYYATTGVELDDVKFDNGRLEIQVKPSSGIHYTIQFWGSTKTAKAGARGVLLKEIKGAEGVYQLRSQDLFVRAKIISSRQKENPYQKGDMETAWTQPVILQKK